MSYNKERKDVEERVGLECLRYPHVAFTTDEQTRRRYIAITEDLDKVPTEEELKRFKKEFERKRDAFEVEAELATEIPSPTVPRFDVGNAFRQPSIVASNLETATAESHIIAPPPPVHVNGDQEEDPLRSETNVSYTTIPPYRYVWSEHV